MAKTKDCFDQSYILKFEPGWSMVLPVFIYDQFHDPGHVH